MIVYHLDEKFYRRKAILKKLSFFDSLYDKRDLLEDRIIICSRTGAPEFKLCWKVVVGNKSKFANKCLNFYPGYSIQLINKPKKQSNEKKQNKKSSPKSGTSSRRKKI